MSKQERQGAEIPTRRVEVRASYAHPPKFIMTTETSGHRNLGTYEPAMSILRGEERGADILSKTYGIASVGASLWGIVKIAEGVRKHRASDVIKGLGILTIVGSGLGIAMSEQQEVAENAREGQVGIYRAIRSGVFRLQTVRKS